MYNFYAAPALRSYLFRKAAILGFLSLFLTFLPGIVHGQATYFVALGLTPNTSTSNGYGLTFNVKAKKVALKITNFYSGMISGSQWEIWYKKDSINGTQTVSTANGWIQHETGTFTGTGVVNLNMKKTISIPAGKTYGFAIVTVNGSPYFIANATPNTFADNNLQVYTGPNVTYWGLIPNFNNTGYRWCGTVYYQYDKRAPNDVGINALTSPKAGCAGTQDVTVTIENYGTKKLTSATINWSIDGVAQTAYSYTGSLDTSGGSGSTTASIKIGTISLTSTAKKLRIWTSSPNGVADTVNTNDTISTTVKAGLSGSYTIGGTTPDYASVAAAASDLTNYGVCGPVTFDIRAGTYTGRVQLGSGGIPGTSSTNTITFKGAGKTTTTITQAGSSLNDMTTVLLDGADFVTFKDVTISNTGTSYGVAVQLTNTADYNTFDNCNIAAAATATSSTTGALICSGSSSSLTTVGMAGNFNTFKNNAISGGYYGVVLTGASTAAGGYAMSNKFLNNTILNYYQYGMYLYYTGETKIIGNTINTTRLSSAYGLYFWYQSNYEVTNNNINVGYYGIYGYYGNYYNYNSTGTKTLVANNLINSTTLYGMYYYYPYYVTFHHNTFRGASTYNVYIGSPNATEFKSNIFINTATTASYYNFYVTGTPSFNAFDYNIFWSPSLTNPYYWNGTTYASLAAWQTAQTQFNQNSVYMDPKVKVLSTTIGATDLHLDNSILVPYGPNMGYTTDVDGDKRCLLAPTIGGDESITGKDLMPKALISVDDTVYVNSPTDFTGNQTPGVPHNNLWYINNVFVKDSVDAVLTFTSTGTYSVKVVAQGCGKKDSFIKTITVVTPKSAPKPDFIASANTVKVGETVKFSDLTTGGAVTYLWEITPKTSYDANGNLIQRYAYTFGNDKNRNIVVRFDAPGEYKVCLTATNSAGTATTCKVAYIKVPFSYNLALSPPKVIENSGYIYDNGGPGSNYSVNLTSGILLAPCASEVYLMFKNFELECGVDYLRIYDGENNKGTPIYACPGPGLTGLSTATCANLCRPGLKDTFKAKSGKMFIEMSSSTATAYAGFEAFWWSKPKQANPPVAAFEMPSSVCVDMPVSFINKSTGESVTYQWDLDDDMDQFETSNKDAAYVYFNPGKYMITLVAYNCGGTDTFRKELTVTTPNTPGVAFTADNQNPTTNDIVNFMPDIDECVSEYFWRFTPTTGTGKAFFMNSTKSTSAKPQIRFSDTGCYNVFLYARNAGGEDSLELTCFIKVKSPYCIPTVNNLVPDIGISEVTITSGQKTFLSNKSTQGQKAYQSFTSTVTASLEAGGSYDLKVGRNTNDNPVTRTAWIDWNLDGDFADAGEKLGEQKNSSAYSWTVNFTVPTTVKLGASVLRIAINQGSLTNTVCGPNKYGEFEDYRIYITPDLTKPVITLIGKDTVFVEQGFSYTEDGAKAEDNLDGDITANIKKTNVPTFDNMIPGTYLVYFDVQDAEGNQADRVTRVIMVTPDKTAPDLVVSENDTVYVDAGTTGFVPPSAVLAEDLVDGDLLSEVKTVGTVNTAKVGVYVITYTVTDASGNTATITRTIIVRDLVAPVIILSGTDTVYVEVNTPYNDAGVTYSDNYCTNAEMASNLLMTKNLDITHTGTYIIVYNLTDCNGNAAVAVIRTVIVQDTKAPLVKLNGDTLVILDVFDTYADKGVTTSDNYGTPTVTKSGTFYKAFPTGKTNDLGDYTITYTSTDSAGNKTSVQRTIRVVDRVAPVITLLGNPTVTLCRWASYTDAGYGVSDNFNVKADIKVDQEGDFVNTAKSGFYSLRYKATDKSGNIGYTDWRYIRVLNPGETGCSTGIENPDPDKHITVYPNPNNGKFTVSFDLGTHEQVSIKVFNALGEQVTEVSQGYMSANTLTIDLGSQANGMYMLHITAGNQSVVKRVIVNR
jgi:parallel beta-helix repeat protein